MRRKDRLCCASYH